MSWPLPAQSFYRLPDITVSVGTIVGVLDALYSALIQTTDFAGASLPASYQWPWTRYQNAGTTEAVYTTGIPSGSSLTRTPRIIFAGRVTIGTPTMLVDTATSSNLMLGMNLNSGAFNAWDNAAPFTSGPFSGFIRVAATGANAIGTGIRVYVSQEIVFVVIIQNATSQYWMMAGCPVEPFTSDTATDADSDNRLYGFASTGPGATAFSLTAGSSQDMFTYQASNGLSHSFLFKPGTSTSGATGLYNTEAAGLFRRTASATCFQTLSGSIVNQPIWCQQNSGTQLLGRYREIYFFGSKQGGLTYSVSSVNKVHIISSNNSSAADAISLKSA
jgi:hypothetical protein